MDRDVNDLVSDHHQQRDAHGRLPARQTDLQSGLAHELPHHRALLRLRNLPSIRFFSLVRLGFVAPARRRHHRPSDEEDVWPFSRTQGQNPEFHITALHSGQAGEGETPMMI